MHTTSHEQCYVSLCALMQAPENALQDTNCACPTQSSNNKEPNVPLLGLVASNAALKKGKIVPSISFAVSGTVLSAVVSAAQKDMSASRSLPLAHYHTPELERIDRPQSKL